MTDTVTRPDGRHYDNADVPAVRLIDNGDGTHSVQAVICGVGSDNLALSAFITEDGELQITETEREKNVGIMLTDSQTDVATYWYGLIDKSDTTNWPHALTGRIDLSLLRVNVDKQGNGTGEIAIGVITRVDGTDADIEFVYSASFTQNDSISFVHDMNYAPTQVKCSVVGGTLNRFKSTITADNVSAINTAGGDLQFNGTTFTPAVGDIVARFIKTGAGAVRFNITAFYHGQEQTT